MMTMLRKARLSGDALVDGVDMTVTPRCNMGLTDDDQSVAGRLVTARGVPPCEGAGAAQGTALPQPSARRATRRNHFREYWRESVELRFGYRREFERYAMLAWAVSRQVRL